MAFCTAASPPSPPVLCPFAVCLLASGLTPLCVAWGMPVSMPAGRLASASNAGRLPRSLMKASTSSGAGSTGGKPQRRATQGRCLKRWPAKPGAHAEGPAITEKTRLVPPADSKDTVICRRSVPCSLGSGVSASTSAPHSVQSAPGAMQARQKKWLQGVFTAS